MTGKGKEHDLPFQGAFELPVAEANFSYEDLTGNFPEINEVKQTEGVLNVEVNFAAFDQSILQRHASSNFVDAYDTRGNPRGLCLIINNRIFANHSERIGTDIDCENLDRLFGQLLYKVEIVKNQTAEQMKSVCKRFVLAPDHEKYASCILVILSHGTNGKILGSDSKAVDEYADILALFNSPQCKLVGKPKLVIIQACRVSLAGKTKGTQHPPPSQETMDGPVPTEDEEEFDLVEHMRRLNYKDAHLMDQQLPPDFADLIIAHSTLPGYVSWRHMDRGSWFIQALVQIFSRKFHLEHVADMMVQVNQLVSQVFGQNYRSQMPCPTNHLRKKFYFLPSGEP